MAPSARVSLTWPLVPLFPALPFFFACCTFPLKGLLSPLLLMFWLIIVVLLLWRWWRFPLSSSQQQASIQQGSQSPLVKMQRRPCRTLFGIAVIICGVWRVWRVCHGLLAYATLVPLRVAGALFPSAWYCRWGGAGGSDIILSLFFNEARVAFGVAQRTSPEFSAVVAFGFGLPAIRARVDVRGRQDGRALEVLESIFNNTASGAEVQRSAGLASWAPGLARLVKMAEVLLSIHRTSRGKKQREK